MRIAVLVFGRLNNCVEHYNNIISMLNINRNKIDFFLSSDNSPQSLLNDFIGLYKPILYNNDPIHYNYNLDVYPGKRPETNIHNMICHFINKNRVMVLLERYINNSNIHYDVIVSLRIDCVYKQKLIITTPLNYNTIYIPNCCDYVDNAVNDQFAYGNLHVMKKYNYINPIQLLDNNLSIPHPESLTYANIMFNNIKIERFDFQYYISK